MATKKEKGKGKYTDWDWRMMRLAKMTPAEWEQAHKDSLAWLERFRNRDK